MGGICMMPTEAVPETGLELYHGMGANQTEGS